MKIIQTLALVIVCFYLCNCSTPTESTGSLLPYKIKDVTDGTAFYDGGTIVIHFVLEDDSEWGLMCNKRLGDESNPQAYKVLSISQNNYSDKSKISIQEMRLKIGSKEEYQLLSLLYEFRKKHPCREIHTPLYWVDALLKEKEYRPSPGLLTDN